VKREAKPVSEMSGRNLAAKDTCRLTIPPSFRLLSLFSLVVVSFFSPFSGRRKRGGEEEKEELSREGLRRLFRRRRLPPSPPTTTSSPWRKAKSGAQIRPSSPLFFWMGSIQMAFWRFFPERNAALFSARLQHIFLAD